MGIYTEETLPKYDYCIGSWDSYEDNNITYLYDFDGYGYEQYFEVVSGKTIKLSTGTNNYRFGYWADEDDGEVFIVKAFNTTQLDDKYVYYYAFDEEVDVSTVNLANYEPRLKYKEEWELTEEAGNKYIGKYIVNSDDSLSINWGGIEYCYYTTIFDFNRHEVKK